TPLEPTTMLAVAPIRAAPLSTPLAVIDSVPPKRVVPMKVCPAPTVTVPPLMARPALVDPASFDTTIKDWTRLSGPDTVTPEDVYSSNTTAEYVPVPR